MIYRGPFVLIPGTPSGVMIPLYAADRNTSLADCLQESYKNVTKRSNFIYPTQQFSREISNGTSISSESHRFRASEKRFAWVSCSRMSPQRACKDLSIWTAELKLLLRPKIIAVLLLFGGWQQENRWTMDIGDDFIDSLVASAVFTMIPSTELQFHSNFLSKSINASKQKWKNLQHIS